MLWARRNASSPKTSRKFLLLLDFLLVKDSAELVEGILCVTAQSRDVLRGILPYVDGSLCNDNFYCEKCIGLRILFLLLC